MSGVLWLTQSVLGYYVIVVIWSDVVGRHHLIKLDVTLPLLLFNATLPTPSFIIPLFHHLLISHNVPFQSSTSDLGLILVCGCRKEKR
jgi:hypothetical protein